MRRQPNLDPPEVIELTAPAYVVLGMVRLGASSGYAIKRMVDRSIRFFWTISQVQIYPSLEQLERAGLIIGREDPRGRRPRRVYEITKSGEEMLQRWLVGPAPMPFELRDIGLVKLFFADALGCDQATELLAAVRQRSAERVAQLHRIEPDAEAARAAGNLYPLLTLRMGVAYHQALIDVCDDFVR
jgi:PadR family transcriptional regulator, regulatory protein AphA